MTSVAIAALATGCLPAWQGPEGAPPVAAVGDSYLRQLEFSGPTHPDSDTAFTESLIDEGWQATVSGKNGWPTRRVHRLVTSAMAVGADSVAVVAGVNDVAWVNNQPHERRARNRVTADLRATLTTAGPARCVVWPTISPAARGAHRSNRTVRAINETLRRQAERRPNLTVPEWGRRLRGHPEWIGPDGLHLSLEGEAVFQDVLLRALRSCVNAALT